MIHSLLSSFEFGGAAMKKGFAFLLILGLLLALAACGESTTTISVPDFPDTPEGRLAEQWFWFDREIAEAPVYEVEADISAVVTNQVGNRVGAATISTDSQIDLENEYMEIVAVQSGETASMVVKRVNGHLAVLTMIDGKVATQLADSDDFIDLLTDESADVEDAEDLPEGAILTESDGLFTAELTGSTIFENDFLSEILESLDVSASDMAGRTLTWTFGFSEDHRTCSETLAFSYHYSTLSGYYELSVNCQIDVSAKDSVTFTDLSGYVFCEPEDRELATPLDLRGTAVDSIRSVNLDSSGEYGWVALILDPGFYAFRDKDGYSCSGFVLYGPDGEELDPDAAVIAEEGTYYLGIKWSSGTFSSPKYWIFQYPESQVGIPSDPIYFQQTGYKVSGTATSAEKYMLYPALAGQEQLVTLTVDSMSGALTFSVGGQVRTLERGRTYTFQVEAGSPVICAVSGSGTYTFDLCVEPN